MPFCVPNRVPSDAKNPRFIGLFEVAADAGDRRLTGVASAEGVALADALGVAAAVGTAAASAVALHGGDGMAQASGVAAAIAESVAAAIAARRLALAMRSRKVTRSWPRGRVCACAWRL
jgi:hypothetical protein